MQSISWQRHLDHRARRRLAGRKLGDGFVQVGVKHRTFRLDSLAMVLGQYGRQLLQHHFNAFQQPRSPPILRRGLNRSL
jgi:hypothetical protein